MIHPLVEITDAPQGLTELKVRDAHGNRIAFCQVASADVDDDLIDDLISWAARHSHSGLTLSLHRSSASRA